MKLPITGYYMPITKILMNGLKKMTARLVLQFENLFH